MEPNQTVTDVRQKTIEVLAVTIRELQRKVVTDPSKENLAKLEKATNLLRQYEVDAATQAERVVKRFTTIQSVLDYAKQCNRKVSLRKLKMDIASGALIRQNDMSFLQPDVDKYFETLKWLGTPDDVADDARLRQEKKDNAEIRIKEAQAKTYETKLAKMQGELLPKTQVYAELAGRIAVLRDGIKNIMEAHISKYIDMIKNDVNAELLMQEINNDIDIGFNEFAQPMVIDIDVTAIEDALDEEDDEDDSSSGKTKLVKRQTI